MTPLHGALANYPATAILLHGILFIRRLDRRLRYYPRYTEYDYGDGMGNFPSVFHVDLSRRGVHFLLHA